MLGDKKSNHSAEILQKSKNAKKTCRKGNREETGATWHVRGHNSGNRTEVIDRR